MREHEGREGEGCIILQDSAGSLLEEVVVGGRVIYSGRPGTIFHELAYLASMPDTRLDTPRPKPTDDPHGKEELQRQFEEVVLPWYRRLTQPSDSNP